MAHTHSEPLQRKAISGESSPPENVANPPTTARDPVDVERGTSGEADHGEVEDRKGRLEVITININSWTPFRNKWTAEGLPKEMTSATVLRLQEHQLVSDDAIGDAEDWLRSRGYHAVFQPAVRLKSGKTSGGVAIVVREREDVGLADLQLQYGDHKHIECWQ